MQIVITTTYIARHKIYCTELENTISFIIKLMIITYAQNHAKVCIILS